MTKDLPAAAALFPTSLNLDVIAYACTSGATIIGPRQIENIIRKIHRAVEVIDPISAACDALQVLQARSIGFVSPYIISVSKDIRNHFTTKGFQITSSISFDQESESVVASINERDTLKAIEAAASEEVDAIFVSCTNLKSFSILNEAERITGKPVLSSNQALVWSMLKKAKVSLSESELNGFPGKIFTKKYY
jgi:maleate isomerase